jgi:hypothetical protein
MYLSVQIVKCKVDDAKAAPVTGFAIQSFSRFRRG